MRQTVLSMYHRTIKVACPQRSSSLLGFAFVGDARYVHSRAQIPDEVKTLRCTFGTLRLSGANIAGGLSKSFLAGCLCSPPLQQVVLLASWHNDSNLLFISAPQVCLGPVRWAFRACLSFKLGKPQLSSISASPCLLWKVHFVFGDHSGRSSSYSCCPLSS